MADNKRAERSKGRGRFQFMVEVWKGKVYKIPSFHLLDGGCNNRVWIELEVGDSVGAHRNDEVNIRLEEFGPEGGEKTLRLVYRAHPRMVMNHGKPTYEYYINVTDDGIYCFYENEATRVDHPCDIEWSAERILRMMGISHSQIQKLGNGEYWDCGEGNAKLLNHRKRTILTDGQYQNGRVTGARYAVEIYGRKGEEFKLDKWERKHDLVVGRVAIFGYCSPNDLADVLAPYLFGPGADHEFVEALYCSDRARRLIDKRHQISASAEDGPQIKVDDTTFGLMFGGAPFGRPSSLLTSPDSFGRLEQFATLYYRHGPEILEEKVTARQLQWIKAHQSQDAALLYIQQNYQVIRTIRPGKTELMILPGGGKNDRRYGRLGAIPEELQQMVYAHCKNREQRRKHNLVEGSELVKTLIKYAPQELKLVDWHEGSTYRMRISGDDWVDYNGKFLVAKDNAVSYSIQELLAFVDECCLGSSSMFYENDLEELRNGDGYLWFGNVYKDGNFAFHTNETVLFPIMPGERKHFVLMLTRVRKGLRKLSFEDGTPVPREAGYPDYGATAVLGLTLERDLEGDVKIARFDNGRRYDRVHCESIVSYPTRMEKATQVA